MNTQNHQKEMEKLDQQYNELAVNYEEIYLKAGWNDPAKCAELVS